MRAATRRDVRRLATGAAAATSPPVIPLEQDRDVDLGEHEPVELFPFLGAEAVAVEAVDDLLRRVHGHGRQGHLRRGRRDRSVLPTSPSATGASFSPRFDRVVSELLGAIGTAAFVAVGEPERHARAVMQTLIGHLSAEPAKARLLFVEVGAVGPSIAGHVTHHGVPVIDPTCSSPSAAREHLQETNDTGKPDAGSVPDGTWRVSLRCEPKSDRDRTEVHADCNSDVCYRRRSSSSAGFTVSTSNRPS